MGRSSLWVVFSRRYLRSSVGERHPQGAGTPKEVRCTPSGSSVPVGPARPWPLHCRRAAGNSPASSGATTSWRAPPTVSTCSSSPPPTMPWPRSPPRSCRRRGTTVAHLSGSLGLDALAPHPLRAAVHPLVPLPNGEVGAARLGSGVTFAVAGAPLAPGHGDQPGRPHGRGRRRRPGGVPRRRLHRGQPRGGAAGTGGAGGRLGRAGPRVVPPSDPGRRRRRGGPGRRRRADRPRPPGRLGHAQPPPRCPARVRAPRLPGRRRPGDPAGPGGGPVPAQPAATVSGAAGVTVPAQPAAV